MMENTTLNMMGNTTLNMMENTTLNMTENTTLNMTPSPQQVLCIDDWCELLSFQMSNLSTFYLFYPVLGINFLTTK